MFKAKVTGPDGALYRINLPQPNNNLQSLLQNVGVQTLLSHIKLSRPDLSAFNIEIKARDETGRRLLRASSDTGTLEDLDNAANVLSHAKKCIKAQLKQAVLEERFHDAAELKEAVREMSHDAGKASETYYFPLAGSMWRWMRVTLRSTPGRSESILPYARPVIWRAGGAYYKGPGAYKLLLADWNFAGLDTRPEQRWAWKGAQNTPGKGET